MTTMRRKLAMGQVISDVHSLSEFLVPRRQFRRERKIDEFSGEAK
jgi:hypothetical protein